jgi:hypothetical protein
MTRGMFFPSPLVSEHATAGALAAGRKGPGVRNVKSKEAVAAAWGPQTRLARGSLIDMHQIGVLNRPFVGGATPRAILAYPRLRGRDGRFSALWRPICDEM